jgi:hypothetical protein
MDKDIKLNSICQCCLTDDAPMKNMLTEAYHEVKLIENFKEYSGIDLLKDQPKETNKNICHKCEINLKVCIEFRELCHKSQKKLKERLEWMWDTVKDEPASDDEPLVQCSTRNSKQNRATFAQVFVKNQLVEEAPPIIPKLEETLPGVTDTTVQNDDNDDYFNDDDVDDSEDDSSAPSSKIAKLDEKQATPSDDETSSMPVSIMCYHCDELLPTQKHYLEHKKGHLVRKNGKKVSKRIIRKCYVCQKEVVGYMNHLKKEHRDFKPHTCKKCKMTFNRPLQLRNHLYRHMKAKRFKCMGCKMSFSKFFFFF